MAAAGVVTRLHRGLYAVHCDTIIIKGSTPKAAKPGTLFVTTRTYSAAEIDRAVAGAWSHFAAMNDPMRPEAWA